MLWKGSPSFSEVKPFLAGQLCQVNFEKISSLTRRSKGLQSAPLGAFCNTFDLHLAIVGLLF